MLIVIKINVFLQKKWLCKKQGLSLFQLILISANKCVPKKAALTHNANTLGEPELDWCSNEIDDRKNLFCSTSSDHRVAKRTDRLADSLNKANEKVRISNLFIDLQAADECNKATWRLLCRLS